MILNVQFSKAENAKLPQQSSPTSTAVTIFTQNALCLGPGDYEIHTGVSVKIPTGYIGEITGLPLRDFKLEHTVVPCYSSGQFDQGITVLISVQQNGSLVVPKHYPIAQLYIREDVQFQLYQHSTTIDGTYH